MKKILFTLFVLFASQLVHAQIDSSLLKSSPSNNTALPKLNMDAVYNRPFLTGDKMPVSLGGYAEINWQYVGTDGVSEGHQFQFRRMTLFMASTINKKIKFLSEIEFEEGGKEIAIEFAAIDFEFHPLINLRGGIVMNPIGGFNQNHDGPKWEFTDRPISATQMLPATWSNAGFGLFGKTFKGDWMFGYEAYITGGFDNQIIDNNVNKTYLPASKNNAERFESIASGSPLVTTKVAIRNNKYGELGLSFMGGVYNKYIEDGLQLDEKRRCDVFALDYNIQIPKINTFITSEWAYVQVNVPESYSQQFGEKQFGGFLDIVQPILKRNMLGWDKATLSLACRIEYVDWNLEKFKETNLKIGDELWNTIFGLSLRPSSQTVLRFNYKFGMSRDLYNNPPSNTGGLSFGVSSYF
ncbi:MAG: hypothetical protein Q8M15_17180 [Bacteroidota bacterium]|nr:hypothetical protein [Bacteroidota bacterium]